MANPDVNVDELERYLKDSLVPTENPLDWWTRSIPTYRSWPFRFTQLWVHTHQVFFLCIILIFGSASTVSVERSFSRGRLLISHLRNRLRSNTIQALMCFGDWSRLNLFTPAELISMLKEDDNEDDEDEEILVDDDLVLGYL